MLQASRIHLAVVLFWFCAMGASAQKQAARFYLDENPQDELDHLPFNDYLQWFVNGVALLPGDSAKLIAVHWPRFDTVVVKDKDRPDRVILTRFQPDSGYFFFPYQCCDDLGFSGTVNYTPEQKKLLDSLSPLTYQLPFLYWKGIDDSIHINHLERGVVKFRVINARKTDTLIGTFGDEHITWTTGVFIRGDTFNTAGRPFHLLMGSGYCFDIRVGHSSVTTETDSLFEKGIIFIESPEKVTYIITKQYFRIEYRFLRPETLYITLDAKTGKVSMEVESN
ncbi:MAG: hypothetical protein IM638_17225 [Bacteroidetes bacterium]|nr:hypothetical protein [Bacteroidota bacterium]